METVLRSLFIGAFGACVCCAETNWNRLIPGPPFTPGGAPSIGILNLSGIGAEIKKEGDACTVAKILQGSGAEAAGLKIDDRITHVGEKDVSGLDLLGIAALLRGDPGTTVTLTILRAGEQPKLYEVTRQPVVLTE